MANNRTRLNAKSNNGQELDVQHQSIDTPILPSAEYLAQMEKVSPGIIKWFMDETSREAAARRTLDEQKVNIFEAAQKRGQHYGLAFGLISLAAACLLAYLQAYTAAGIVGGTSLATVAVALIKGKNK